jgi:hypothetical protein
MKKVQMLHGAAQMNVTNFSDISPLPNEKNYKLSPIFARFDFLCYIFDNGRDGR